MLSDFRELLKIFEKHKIRISNGKAPFESRYYVSIPGIEFEEAWNNREVVQLDDLKLLKSFNNRQHSFKISGSGL